VRARYGADPTSDDASMENAGSLAWTIGLNELEADHDLWYTLADVVAARLLGRTTPTILGAFRIVPHGRLSGLQPIKLRGTVAVDPTRATSSGSRSRSGRACGETAGPRRPSAGDWRSFARPSRTAAHTGSA